MAIADLETTLQLQAANLWTFVHLKSPLFPHSAALDVVQKLASEPEDDLKKRAKRLRKELEAYGVKMPHTTALTAVAKLRGFKGWNDASAQTKAAGRLIAVNPIVGEMTATSCADWAEAKKLLCDAADAWHESTGANLFSVKLGKNYLILAVPVTVATDDGPGIREDSLLMLCPSSNDDVNWLTGAEHAIEALRRRLEETGKATLDGVAVTAFCENMVDAVNSELVVMQNEDELDPGFEIARGDEVECWAQLERLEGTAGLDARLEAETGAWWLGRRRFTFDVATIRPHEYIPGLRTKVLNEDESAKLFRRYRLMRQRAAGSLPVRSSVKQFELLGAPASAYRVNLHRLLLEMNKQGLTWEGYCEEVGSAEEMQPILQLGFLLPLLERLNLVDPNAVFARPARSELTSATDLKYFRALLPRAHHVRFRTSKDLTEQQKAVVQEAIEVLSSSILVRHMNTSHSDLAEDQQIAHLAYAYDADELTACLEANDLDGFVGVMPYLKRTDLPNAAPNSSPFAFGLSLYLDIDVAGGAA